MNLPLGAEQTKMKSQCRPALNPNHMEQSVQSEHLKLLHDYLWQYYNHLTYSEFLKH